MQRWCVFIEVYDNDKIVNVKCRHEQRSRMSLFENSSWKIVMEL